MKRMLSGGDVISHLSPSWARPGVSPEDEPSDRRRYHIIPWNFIGLATPKEDWISHRGRGRRGFRRSSGGWRGTAPREDLVEALFGEMQKIRSRLSFWASRPSCL